MTYENLAIFAQKGGSLYFALVFFGVCIYAFLPKNKPIFDRAANLPLDNSNDDAPEVMENENV